MKRLRDYSGDRNGEDTNSPACQWFGFLLVIYDLTHFKTMLNTKTSTKKKKNHNSYCGQLRHTTLSVTSHLYST